MTHTNTVQLSKWWMTPSAQAAFKRVEIARQERIAKVRAAFAAKKQELQDAVNNWKEVK
jgi:hypothetical protein